MDMRSSMPLRPLRVVLPGGSGHIGQLLARYFQQNGHHVTVLTRKPYAAEWQTMHWDGEHAGPWVRQLENAEVCINLAGRSVNCRYTAAHQREIYDSRIGATRLLNQVIGSLTNPPRVWLNASTATIYRHALDREMDEDTGELGGGEMISRNRRAPAKWDFSVRVAKEWERSFFEINTPQTRKVALRSAIVFSASPGGAFALYSRLVRLGLGGAQGSGRQLVSWIHEADFVRSVLFLVFREDLAGPFNLAAPNPLPNHEFM
ncbi:MAG TPA: NAD-dependent epimerase/dehydratase family protein, partial [Terracidiphilus sp.]|nr:NAD-dependent epimerase/dehydratase family protein [Terracidiphilus sp.]